MAHSQCYRDLGAEPHYFGMRRIEDLWTPHIVRGLEAISYGEREPENCTVKRKRYADHRRRELRFEVGDFVYLKVSPMRGLHHYKVSDKLEPWFIGPFKITEKRGEVAYQLELLLQLLDVHNVFHVSQLEKCLHVLEDKNIHRRFDC
jgi:hypothetical protein